MRRLSFVLYYEVENLSTEVEVLLGEGIPSGATDAEIQDALQRAICEGYLAAKREIEEMKKDLAT
jgi:hypothetical protein